MISALDCLACWKQGLNNSYPFCYFFIRKYALQNTIEVILYITLFQMHNLQSFWFIFPSQKARFSRFSFLLLNLTTTTRKENQTPVINVWGFYLKLFSPIQLCRIYIMNHYGAGYEPKNSCFLILCFIVRKFLEQ